MSKAVKLTVKEFAKFTGVSRQAVYRRIKNGELAKYIDEADGVTTIDSKAAALFTANTVKFTDNSVKVDSKPDVKFTETEMPAEDIPADNDITIDTDNAEEVDSQVYTKVDNPIEKVLLYQAERIKELEADNRRLYEVLSARADEQAKATQELAKRLADLIEQQNILQQNSQMLLAQQKQPAESSASAVESSPGEKPGFRNKLSGLFSRKK